MLAKGIVAGVDLSFHRLDGFFVRPTIRCLRLPSVVWEDDAQVVCNAQHIASLFRTSRTRADSP